MPNRQIMLACALLAVTPAAGVVGARFVGRGPARASAAEPVSMTPLPEIPPAPPASDPDRFLALRSPFPEVTLPAEPAPILVVDAPGEPAIPNTPDLALTSVMPHPTRPLAVINGRPWTTGDEVAPCWTLTSIDGHERRVVLTGPDGRLIALTMRQPRR